MYQTNSKLLRQSKLFAAFAVMLLMLAVIVTGALLGIASGRNRSSAEAAGTYNDYYNVNFDPTTGIYTVYNCASQVNGGSTHMSILIADETAPDTWVSFDHQYMKYIDAGRNLQWNRATNYLVGSNFVINFYEYATSRLGVAKDSTGALNSFIAGRNYNIKVYFGDAGTQVVTFSKVASIGKMSFSVNFNVDGNLYSQSSKRYGETITLPQAPAKEGYTFEGWYYNQSYTNAYNQGDVATSNKELYAKFSINYYSAIYYIDGVKVFDSSLPYGTQLTAPEITGYNFAGWFRNAAFSVSSTGIVTGDTVLYAKYTPKQFTVTIYGYNNVVVNQQLKNYNTALTLNSSLIPNVEGRNFVGWYLDSDYQTVAPSNIITVYGNLDIYIKYNVNLYTVNLYGLNGILIESSQVPHGTPIVYDDLPQIEGYTFSGIYEDQAFTIPFAGTTVTSNLNGYAKFVPIMCTYRVVGFSGSDLRAGSVSYGTVLDAEFFVAPSIPNRSFLGWYTDAAFSAPFTTTSQIKTNIVIYARYSSLSYTLRIYLPTGSINTVPFADSLLVTNEMLTPNVYDGLIFSGFYTDSTYQTPFSAGTTIVADTNLYAKYTGVTYTVRVNGLTDFLYAVEVAHGASISPSALTVANIDGYTFFGWYTDPEFKYAFNSGDLITSNISIYAKYTRNTFSVKAYASVMTESPFYTVDCLYGTFVYERSLSLAEKPGYNFIGWYSDVDLSQAVTFPLSVTGNISLYPKYSIKEFRYNIYGYNSMLLHTGMLNYGSVIPVTNFVAPAVDGYEFLGWYRDSAFTTQYSTNATVSSPVSIYGKYILKKCTVAVYGFNNAVIYSGSVDYGATVPAAALHVNNVSGYTFCGYYAGQASGNTVFTAESGVFENTAIYLNYVKNQYHYQILGFGNEILSSGDVYYGDTLPETAAPEMEGYGFIGWYTDPGFVSSFNFGTAISSNIYIYAKYSADIYTYTFLDSLSQSTVSSGTFIYGNSAPLPQSNAHSGYNFNGWYLANTETGYDSTVKYSSDIVVEARYTRIQYTYTLTSDYGYTYSGSVYYGDVIPTPTAPEVSGYTFDGWYTTPNYTTAYNFSTPATANVSLYGKYVPVEAAEEKVSPWGFIGGGIALIVLLGAGYFIFTKFFKGKRKRAF